jgi:hypothetical protein
MFPNLRLLIGALAASVAALCCGFGVFAAFRVNHEPLSRLPAATAPLQLVINEAAAPGPTWGAPVAGLAPLNVSDVGPAAIIRPAISSAPPTASDAGKVPPRAAVAPAALVDAPRQHAMPPTTQTASATPAVAAKPTPLAEAQRPASVTLASTALSAPSTAATVRLPAPPSDKTNAVAQTASAPPEASGAVEASGPPPQTLRAKSAAPPAASELASATPNDSANPPAAAVAAIDAPPAPSLPAERPAEIGTARTEDIRPAAERHDKPAEAVRPATMRKTVAKAIERRRSVARRRLVRKPRAPVVAQFGGDASAFHDPVFRSAPDFQPRSATRTRSAKKTLNGDAATTSSFTWPSLE